MLCLNLRYTTATKVTADDAGTKGLYTLHDDKQTTLTFFAYGSMVFGYDHEKTPTMPLIMRPFRTLIGTVVYVPKYARIF
jgi:hypothetical protein